MEWRVNTVTLSYKCITISYSNITTSILYMYIHRLRHFISKQTTALTFVAQCLVPTMTLGSEVTTSVWHYPRGSLRLLSKQEYLRRRLPIAVLFIQLLDNTNAITADHLLMPSWEVYFRLCHTHVGSSHTGWRLGQARHSFAGEKNNSFAELSARERRLHLRNSHTHMSHPWGMLNPHIHISN